jgi:hypothetical protein
MRAQTLSVRFVSNWNAILGSISKPEGEIYGTGTVLSRIRPNFRTRCNCAPGTRNARNHPLLKHLPRILVGGCHGQYVAKILVVLGQAIVTPFARGQLEALELSVLGEQGLWGHMVPGGGYLLPTEIAEERMAVRMQLRLGEFRLLSHTMDVTMPPARSVLVSELVMTLGAMLFPGNERPCILAGGPD